MVINSPHVRSLFGFRRGCLLVWAMCESTLLEDVEASRVLVGVREDNF